MSCAHPIDAAILADYWLAALPPPEEEMVEEHLFTCDECGARLREIVALADAVRELARRGTLLTTVTDAFLKRVADQGMRVREYAPPKGGRVECTVTEEDDFLIGRLTADLTGAARVDLCICDPAGAEQMRLRDVPFHAGASQIVFQQPIEYAKAAPTSTMIARLVAVGEGGQERLLGEYTFNHTRKIPGPAGW